MNLLYNHLSVNQDGHLAIGGLDTIELAREFGTPAYIMDEDAIRTMMRTYLDAAHTYFGADALPLYASKALCFTGIYRIAAEEGMGVDCVSGGELYTAKRAGFPAERIYFTATTRPKEISTTPWTWAWVPSWWTIPTSFCRWSPTPPRGASPSASCSALPPVLTPTPTRPS